MTIPAAPPPLHAAAPTGTPPLAAQQAAVRLRQAALESPPPRPHINWDQLFDGQVYDIDVLQHWTGSYTSLRTTIYTQAKKRGLRVATATRPADGVPYGHLRVQALLQEGQAPAWRRPVRIPAQLQHVISAAPDPALVEQLLTRWPQLAPLAPRTTDADTSTTADADSAQWLVDPADL